MLGATLQIVAIYYSVLLHGFEHLKYAIEFECHGSVASLTHGFLCDNAGIDMRLQVCYLLLNIDSILYDLLLGLLGLDSYLEGFVDDFLEILDHVVVLRLEVLVCLVDDADEDFTVVLQGAPQSLQIVVNLA